jgi:hypothetical protein
MRLQHKTNKTSPINNGGAVDDAVDNSDPDQVFIGEKDLAAMFPGTKPKRWERARLEGWGPPYIRIGRTPLYRLADVLSWAESRKFTSTSGET